MREARVQLPASEWTVTYVLKKNLLIDFSNAHPFSSNIHIHIIINLRLKPRKLAPYWSHSQIVPQTWRMAQLHSYVGFRLVCGVARLDYRQTPGVGMDPNIGGFFFSRLFIRGFSNGDSFTFNPFHMKANFCDRNPCNSSFRVFMPHYLSRTHAQ
jgi:hypothetical protein